MNDSTRREVALAARLAAERLYGRVDGKLMRVHERIDALVGDVAGIKARVSLFPTPQELDAKIKREIAACDRGHAEKDRIRSEISKKDWLKIIVAIVTLIAGALGLNISLQ